MRRRSSEASICFSDLLPREPLVLVVHREVELRREHVGVARPRLEHVAEERLRRAERVDVGGVDEVDAGVERGVDAGPRLVVRDAAAVGQPRAEADLRHAQVTVSELSQSHRSIVAKAARMPSGPATTLVVDGESRRPSSTCAPSAAPRRPLARALPRLRRVRDAGRGSRARTRTAPACPRRRACRAAAASPRRRRRRGVRAASRPACPSSTACSAAASCPRRSCSSAASRASASRRCS